MTISVLYIVQLHAGKKRRAALWKLCCGILLKLESLKRGKRKSLQWAIFKAENLKRIRTGRYWKWTEIRQSPPKHAFEGWWEGDLERVHSRCILRLDRAEIQTWTLPVFCAELVEIMTFFFFLRSIYPLRFFNFVTCAPCVRSTFSSEKTEGLWTYRKLEKERDLFWVVEIKYCKTQDNILNDAAATSSSTAVQYFRFSFVCRIFFLKSPAPYPWLQRLTIGDEKFLACPQESIEAPMTGNGKLISTSFKK